MHGCGEAHSCLLRQRSALLSPTRVDSGHECATGRRGASCGGANNISEPSRRLPSRHTCTWDASAVTLTLLALPAQGSRHGNGERHKAHDGGPNTSHSPHSRDDGSDSHRTVEHPVHQHTCLLQRIPRRALVSHQAAGVSAASGRSCVKPARGKHDAANSTQRVR